MEFFRYIDRQVSEDQLKQQINPKSVAIFAETMLFHRYENDYFKAETLWGTFNISFDRINGGVRFALLDCPNAVTWTITAGHPPKPNMVVLHSTINRTHKPEDFMEEYMEFLDEWEAGIKARF